MKRTVSIALLAATVVAFASAQSTTPPKHRKATRAQVARSAENAVDVAGEKNHKLLFENEKTRVFRFELPPGETTDTHDHPRDYLVIALTDINARDTHAQRRTESAVQMRAGELQIIKVPQTARIANVGGDRMVTIEVEIREGFHPDQIVCGLGKRMCPSDVGDISDPALQYSVNFVLETDAVRVRDVKIGPGATLTRDSQNRFLRVPVTPLTLLVGDNSVRASPGEVAWVDAARAVQIANKGNAEARWYEIEFK